MDRDTIRRGGTVGSTVGGGGTLVRDGGREVCIREHDGAAGPRLIRLHSRAHRPEGIRTGQLPGISGQEAPRVGVTRERRGNLIATTGSRREHNAARPEFHGTSPFWAPKSYDAEPPDDRASRQHPTALRDVSLATSSISWLTAATRCSSGRIRNRSRT